MAPTYKKGISVAEPPADTSPEAELASFKVLEGFEVNLFASEKDGIPNALVIRWDERGRLWCLQTSAYPQPAPGDTVDDKVVILEDTDRDGRADKSTIWARGLRMPMGMELGGPGQLYVGEGEKLLLLTDTDGDDQADQKDVVFSGFGTGDTHQNLNSFIWAPEGCLIMHQGLHCYSRVVTPWGVKQLYGGGFWRFWPRSRKLEAYPTGMPANAWGTAFDRWGQPIMVAGAAGMFWARPMEVAVGEMEGSRDSNGNTVRHANEDYHFLLTRFMLPHNGQIIKTQGLRKYCGVDIVGNSHWPNEMQGEVIAGGFFENAVYRYKIVDDKENPSGFEAVEQTPLITSDNVAFRAVDVRFGPDGALYIADWFNPIIGHYQASFRHPNRDKDHGRIWRVKVKGKPLVSNPPDVAKLSDQDLVLTLRDENLRHLQQSQRDRWLQYQAQRILAAKVGHGAFPAEQWTEYARQGGWLGNQEEIAKAFLRLHQLASTPSLSLIDSAHYHEVLVGHRAYAAHALGDWAAAIPGALNYADAFVRDQYPRVRLEAVVAAAKIKHPDAIKVALKALDKPMDSFLDRALWLAVHATAPQWKSKLKDEAFLETLPPHHVAYLVEKEGSDELLAAVRRFVAVKKGTLPPDTLRGLTIALVTKGKAADVIHALKLGANDPAFVGELALAPMPKGFAAPPEALMLVEQWLTSGTDAQKTGACQIAGEWKLKSCELAIRALGSNGVAETRAAALVALGKLRADATLFETVLNDVKEPWAIRVAALNGLAESKPMMAGIDAAQHLSKITDTNAMLEWLSPVLAREGATSGLVKALNKEPCSVEAAKLALAAMTASGRSDPALAAAFSKIVGAKNTLPSYDPTWVEALATEVKASGDPTKGKAVFNAPLSGCVGCHQINKSGGIIGPELDAVGRGVPAELLIEAVVWPNRQIKEGYVATTLTTNDGRRMQGYKITEGNGEMQIKDLLSGTVARLPINQIKERQEAGSLMPEGLILNMTREELRNLIAYLAALGR